MSYIANVGPSEVFTRLNRFTQREGTYVLTLPPGHALGTALARRGALPEECSDVILTFFPDDVLKATYTVFVTHDQAAKIIQALDDVEGTAGTP